jgi:hypothetical protein
LENNGTHVEGLPDGKANALFVLVLCNQAFGTCDEQDLGKYCGTLALPFMLVHGVRPDQRTWLPLLSLCYFHHEKESNALRSKNQVHTLDGIVIRQSPTSNAILVYNPRNQCYYKPNSYKLDPYHLPSSVYPTIIYDGGLFVSLH